MLRLHLRFNSYENETSLQDTNVCVDLNMWDQHLPSLTRTTENLLLRSGLASRAMFSVMTIKDKDSVSLPVVSNIIVTTFLK